MTPPCSTGRPRIVLRPSYSSSESSTGPQCEVHALDASQPREQVVAELLAPVHDPHEAVVAQIVIEFEFRKVDTFHLAVFVMYYSKIRQYVPSQMMRTCLFSTSV